MESLLRYVSPVPSKLRPRRDQVQGNSFRNRVPLCSHHQRSRSLSRVHPSHSRNSNFYSRIRRTPRRRVTKTRIHPQTMPCNSYAKLRAPLSKQRGHLQITQLQTSFHACNRNSCPQRTIPRAHRVRKHASSSRVPQPWSSYPETRR